jgi:sugar phosphate isomerase/epimerase
MRWQHGDDVNELSLANLSVADAGPLELLDAAAAAGFYSVNMWLVPPPAMAAFTVKCGATKPVVGDQALIREINRRIATNGVGVFQASCGWLSADFDPSAAARVLDAMAQIGARRASLVGWDADRSRLIAHLAALCAQAATYGIAVTLEFMPYSQVRSIADAADVLAAAAAPNLDVLVDALHLARSGGAPTDLQLLDPAQIGCLQLCDAPAIAPPAERLREESVNRRRYPGQGDLPLHELLAALRDDIVIEIEIPAAEHAAETIAERAQLCAHYSRRFLDGYRALRSVGKRALLTPPTG